MTDYVFGYGSLINTASRLRTVPDAHEIIPVNVSRMARGWWLNSTRRKRPITYLSVVKTDNLSDVCNGVLFEVNDETLAALDKREQGYDRVKFTAEDVTCLRTGDALPEAVTLWTYVVQPEVCKQVPSQAYPLLYSYVDICLLGCLQMEHLAQAELGDFTERFIEMTHDWAPYWVDDREAVDDERLGADKAHIDGVIDSIKATYGGN